MKKLNIFFTVISISLLMACGNSKNNSMDSGNDYDTDTAGMNDPEMYGDRMDTMDSDTSRTDKLYVDTTDNRDPR